MVKYPEMRVMAEIKERNKTVREYVNNGMARVFPGSVEQQLLHSIKGQTETIDWLIGLFERELKVPFTKVDINIAEHLEMVQHGMLKRNNG